MTPGNAYWPCGPVIVAVFAPVSAFANSTRAPATIAPAGSVTAPRIAPVAAVCAFEENGAIAKTSASKRAKQNPNPLTRPPYDAAYTRRAHDLTSDEAHPIV